MSTEQSELAKRLQLTETAFGKETKTDAELRGVDKLLSFVAKGEQQKAEEMLSKDPRLAVRAGNVTDAAGRRFENITALQYAMWAFNSGMSTMIQKHMTRDEIKFQFAVSAIRDWVKDHGLCNKALSENLASEELAQWKKFAIEFGGVEMLKEITSRGEIEQFLGHVARGEQDEAEGMLQKNKALALCSGKLSELSGREFRNITAVQYAVWALDWHMWTMLRKYLPDAAARAQLEVSESGEWLKEHGEFFDLKPLIEAYDQTIKEKSDRETSRPYGDHSAFSITACRQLGNLQRLLPAHVVNEYCDPENTFVSDTDVSDIDFQNAKLLRKRSVYYRDPTGKIPFWGSGDWYNLQHPKSNLKDMFVYTSEKYYNEIAEEVHAKAYAMCPDVKTLKFEVAALRALRDTRIEQREALMAELKPQGTMAPKK